MKHAVKASLAINSNAQDFSLPLASQDLSSLDDGKYFYVPFIFIVPVLKCK